MTELLGQSISGKLKSPAIQITASLNLWQTELIVSISSFVKSASLFVGLYAEPTIRVCELEHSIFRKTMSHPVLTSTGSLMTLFLISRREPP